MAYPASFHRLVLIGSIYTDIFNTTLSIVPGLSGSMPAVSQALLDDVAAQVFLWFPKTYAATGPSITIGATLLSVKLNRINAAGHYQDPDTMEKLAPASLYGGGTTRMPAQLSHVVTLRGNDERAPAGKGRMFLPPTEACHTVGSDGRVTAAQAIDAAEGVRTLLGAINDVYLAAGVNAVAGIASRSGAGAFQAVAKLSAGRTIDTMRSRRNKIPEDAELITM